MKVSKILEAFPKVSRKDAEELAAAIRNANEHKKVDEALDLANEIIGGFGVEAIQPEGAWVDRYYREITLLYVNIGDPYDTTVMYDTEEGEFLIGSWGDWFEAWEQEHAEESEEEEVE